MRRLMEQTGETVNLTGTVSLGGNTLFLRGRGTGTIGGDISGTGSVTKIDTPSTWTLSGSNTYTGDTTVDAGTLEIGGAGILGSGNYAGNLCVYLLALALAPTQ